MNLLRYLSTRRSVPESATGCGDAGVTDGEEKGGEWDGNVCCLLFCREAVAVFESDARCAVLHEDGADRTETEPKQQTLHRDVVAVGIHTQVTVLFQTPRHASAAMPWPRTAQAMRWMTW